MHLLRGLGGNQNIKSINISAASGLGGNRFATTEYQKGNELIRQLGWVASSLPSLVPTAVALGSDCFAAVVNQDSTITTDQRRVRR